MSSYLSILGISTIDNVLGNNVNVQNVSTNSISVSNLTSGLVSSTSEGTLQNATIVAPLQYNGSDGLRISLAGSTGIDYSVRGNTGYISNTGLTSITSGQTGPVYISTSSTGSVQIALPQNITPTSSVDFFTVTTLGDVNCGGYLYSGALSGGGTNNSLAVVDEGTVYSLGGNIIAPIQYNFSDGLRISLAGSTGIDYTVRGNTGYISNTSVTGATGPIGPIGPTGPIGFTGYTGPMGVPGVGGTIGYYANYYSTTTQSIGTTAQQITFPNNFVQNGISLDGNNNIVFSASGTYKITTLLQVNGSNNARFYHWYRYNGVDVANSAFEDHFSSGAGQVLSTSSDLITVNAGDTLGLWGVKTAGTIDVTYTPGSVSPVYPASTSVNVVVSQETYTQIGPTGYTGPMGPVYSAGTNIDISGSNVISTVSNPTFERILNSSLGSTNLLFGTGSGSRLTSGGGNLLIGQNAGQAITTGTFNIGLGSSSYGGGGSMTQNSAQNVAIGNSAMFSATTSANNNVAVGYQTLQTLTDGYNNTAVGYQAGQAVVGGFRNTLVGNNSGYYVTTGNYNCGLGDTSLGGITTGSNNVAIGPNTLTGLTTGSNNVHIGTNTQSRIINAQRAIVISAQTTTSVDRGDDTCFINAPKGLYSYTPAYCQLRSTAFNNGIITWEFWNDGTTTHNIGFTLRNSNRQIVQPFQGLYEVNVTGNAQAQTTLFAAIDLNVINVRFYNIAYQSSASINTFIVNLSGSQMTRPYVSSNPSLTGYEVYCNGANFFSLDFPLFMTVKFISL